jgi:hypothetical protein
LPSPETLCPICHEKERPPSHIKNHIYACSRCWGRKHRARVTRWCQSPHGRAKRQYVDRRRYYLGGGKGYAKSIEEAQRIRAHIKARILAFKQGQQDREKAQVTSAR